MSPSRIAPPIAEAIAQSRPPATVASANVAAADVMPAQWTLLRSPADDGITNMAIDAALLELADAEHHAVWRCYSWDTPTISFGRNERTAGRFSPSRLREAGLPAVRRPTGGRALLHAREVTYSVAMPLDRRVSWQVAYAAVNDVLLRALQSLGVPAQLVTEAEAAAVAPDGPVCFDRPAAGEIVVHGRKLVGSAVWRQGGAYLQHGSMLLADDQAMLAAAADAPMPSPPPAASLEECAPSKANWDVVVDALERALATEPTHRRDRSVEPFVPSRDFSLRVASHHAVLGHHDWLWRR